jgi:polysaccharide export outer membrane protein
MSNSAPRRFIVILLVLLLNACAFAPGMYVGDANKIPDSADNNGLKGWFDSLAYNRPVAAPAGEPQVAPSQIIPITAKLIGQLRAGTKSEISADVKNLFNTPKPYQLGAGDVLNIVVWDHPELSVPAAAGAGTDPGSVAAVGNGFNLSPLGFIQFPYVGQIKLLGMTEYEVRDLLTQRLALYIKDPQITVRVQSYRSGRVYIDGEVRSTGLQAVNDIPMTLPEAIGRAGGLTAMADRSAIAITRQDKTTMVNLPLLTELGVNPANIVLAAGDLVRVLSRDEAKVFVMGEVLRPNTQMLRNGRLTLNEALGDSGGVNQVSGDPRQIFVIRAANSIQPEIYHLDANSPAAYALAEGFELKARDVIYVDPVPLVRWNRVISLMLPSAQAISTTRSSYNSLSQ